MRVLHVLPTLVGGGAEGFVASLVPQLVDRGVECAVMTIYQSRGLPGNLSSGSIVKTFAAERAHRYDAGFFLRMIAQMRSWRPDIVHTHMHNGKYWGRLAAVLTRAPAIVHTAHNPCDVHRSAVEPIADLLLNAASTALVTFSESQRQFLSKLEHIPASKIAVIPNGVPWSDRTAIGRGDARHQLGISGEEHAVVVVGTLYGPKNQHAAIEAFAELSARLREGTRLCIIGDGPDGEKLQQLARGRGLGQRVSFLGHRTNVRDLLHGADAFLMPSLTEGMPLAMLEAMHAGVPVVSTPWIGVYDILESGRLGSIARSWEPGDIARSLEEVLNASGAAAAVAARAQAKARSEYDIRTTAERHCALYQSLLAGSAA